MSTPGTPEWLREEADRLLKAQVPQSGLPEGLVRAANRIERLQGELSKVKTGVDQTKTPRLVNKAKADTQISIHIPEDDAIHERLLAWIVESGDGVLDPCVLTVEGDLKVENGENSERLTLVDLEDMPLPYGRVRVRTQAGLALDLLQAKAMAVGTDKWGQERISLTGKVKDG